MDSLKKILVTGANGFVGRALCKYLLEQGFSVIAVVRRPVYFADCAGEMFQQMIVGNLEEFSDWPKLLRDVDTVIHLAARVHVMHDQQVSPMDAYRKINVNVTKNIAHASALNGVRRFLFISSIKVNGEHTSSQPFAENSVSQPIDPYALSKMEAEIALADVAAKSFMETVVLRPSLIYGPGVKANFERLLGWVERGFPLPFASVNNKRSMLYLENLLSAIAICIQHPVAKGQTYLLSDGIDVSTPELIKLIANAMDRPPRLWSCPSTLMHIGAKITGHSADLGRLVGSLQVDISKIRQELGWSPPYTLQEGIGQTVAWYKR